MRSYRSLSFFFISILLLFSAALGCGGEDLILAITPSGSSVVIKGNTLQFSSNVPGTTWAVVGGAANGTIDASGLYTPPATLPINPHVTIEATSPDGDTEQVFVDLRTGDTLTFGSLSARLNSTSYPGLLAAVEHIYIGVSDRLAVGFPDSLWDHAFWMGVSPAMFLDVFYNAQENLGGFGVEQNLTTSAGPPHFTTAAAADGGHNVGVLYVENNPPTQYLLTFLGSSDDGNNFNITSDVDADPLNDQGMASMQTDANGTYHVVYIEAPDTTGGIDFAGGGHLMYVRSTDHGASWSAPLEVGTVANLKRFPNLAVDASGNNLNLCWIDDNGSAGVTSDVFVASSSNGGSSFNAPVSVSSSGVEGVCRIARGLNGEVYVAYAAMFGSIPPPNGADIRFRRSTDGGASFAAAITVNSSTMFDQIQPMMSVDSLGRIDIVWASNDDGVGAFGDDLYHARSVDNGVTFSAGSHLHGSVAQFVAVPTGLVHDISGRLHLLFLSDVNSPGITYDVFFMLAE